MRGKAGKSGRLAEQIWDCTRSPQGHPRSLGHSTPEGLPLHCPGVSLCTENSLQVKAKDFPCILPDSYVTLFYHLPSQRADTVKITSKQYLILQGAYWQTLLPDGKFIQSTYDETLIVIRNSHHTNAM